MKQKNANNEMGRTRKSQARPKNKGLGYVMGHRMRAPRLTKWAYGYFALYMGLPFLLLMGLIDVALWAIFRFGFDSCYGILCLAN